MFRLLLGLFFSLYAISLLAAHNSNAKNTTFSCPTPSQAHQQLHQSVEDFIPLMEENLVMRATIQRIYERLLEKKKQSTAFLVSQQELDTVFSNTLAAIALRGRFQKVIDRYKPLVRKNFSLAGEGPALSDLLHPQRLLRQKFQVDPNSEAGRLYSERVILYLAAALALYDDYFFLAGMFEDFAELRRKLYAGDNAYGIDPDELRIIQRDAWNRKNRAILGRAIAYFDHYQAWLQQAKSKNKQYCAADAHDLYLSALIKASATYRISHKQHFERAVIAVDHWYRHFLLPQFADGSANTLRESTQIVSGLFGNIVGLWESRKGLLYQNKKIEKDIHSELQPLDILLEKTPFRLTDRLIPGYWGHVAIWIGSKKDLEQRGLWQKLLQTTTWQRLPKTTQDNIRQALEQGHGVLEALRPGVELNSLGHFLNVDAMSVLRPSYLRDDEQRVAVLAKALSHFGKAYDFNFDVGTTDRIVCSELAYQVYTEVNWPIDRTLGRYSISPDRVAQRAIEGGPFEVRLLYLRGQRVFAKKQPLGRTFQALLTP